MKALLSIVIFLVLWFGIFCIINGMIILIFPVSWNECVTAAPWIAVWGIFGGILCGCLTAEIVEEWEKEPA